MQDEVKDFTECMQQRYGRADIQKLGEGSFKEVFRCDDDVVCVIPIEGDIILNREAQPSALKILPELVAHKELSRLREPTAPCGDPAGAPPIADHVRSVVTLWVLCPTCWAGARWDCAAGRSHT